MEDEDYNSGKDTSCKLAQAEKYRYAGNKQIDVIVKYLNPEHSTNGGTKKLTNEI